jgi:hypothetical protein
VPNRLGKGFVRAGGFLVWPLQQDLCRPFLLRVPNTFFQVFLLLLPRRGVGRVPVREAVERCRVVRGRGGAENEKRAQCRS